eukprot:gene4339-5789_t
MSPADRARAVYNAREAVDGGSARAAKGGGGNGGQVAVHNPGMVQQEATGQ